MIRFYSVHFLFPIVLVGLVVLHIIVLHFVHRQSPLGLKSEGVKFFPIFIYKDMCLLVVLTIFLFFLVLFWGFVFIEKEMFELANPLMSPEHIVPE